MKISDLIVPPLSVKAPPILFSCHPTGSPGIPSFSPSGSKISFVTGAL